MYLNAKDMYLTHTYELEILKFRRVYDWYNTEQFCCTQPSNDWIFFVTKVDCRDMLLIIETCRLKRYVLWLPTLLLFTI